MSQIEESIEVNVPVQTAYNQWTQFEEFPRFVEKVGSAVGADDRRVKSDLESFKELIEKRGRESGAWRGEVEPPA